MRPTACDLTQKPWILIRCLTFFGCVLACAAAAAQAAQPVAQPGDTAGEMSWTGRYSSCEYGYSVSLPARAVAHPAKAPSPYHGFSIDPAAPASKQPFVALDAQRRIVVYSFYDLEDHDESIPGTLDYYLSLGDISDEKKVTTLSRQVFGLAGLSGRQVDRWVENSVVIRRLRILLYRPAGGILYQLTLQSPEKTFAADKLLFKRIVAGFHLGKLPTGDCSNE